ncbi:MAG: hypothetical protein OEY36_01045 [Gammaproteobacteria bacterium]|nr:hypothetical protein [Gammaproteobacteria bacterium]
MPVKYQIFPEKKLVIVSYSAELTLQEILAARKKGAADPDFDPAYNVIDDISAVKSSTISFDDIAGISGSSVANKGVKRALFVATDLQKGMAHMYKVLSEASGHDFRIFTDYDQACEWVKQAATDEKG